MQFFTFRVGRYKITLRTKRNGTITVTIEPP